jgi:hypothetical protein
LGARLRVGPGGWPAAQPREALAQVGVVHLQHGGRQLAERQDGGQAAGRVAVVPRQQGQ